MQERTAGTSAGRGVISVAELTQRLKTAIEERFGSVRVEGEMLSVRRVSSGHLYFTLKDQGAQLPAVMWRSTASRCPVALRDGLRVVASGDVQVYPPHGRYQLVVHRVVEAGVGALLAELEALKARLHAEGLFDPHRKRPLPLLPRRVGVVTAATGAALRDIVRAVLARYPARILLAPAKVQGEGAAASIVSALEGLGRHAEVDVIVVGRGGGSLEDLWAFNEEAVVRAVAACPTPVVSAVGHEVDVVLTDHAADVRAATPTAAGALVVPRLDDLRLALDELLGRLERTLRDRVGGGRHAVQLLRTRLPEARRLVAERQQRLDDALVRLDTSMRARLARLRQHHAGSAGRIRGLHPRVRLRAARSALLAVAARRDAAASGLVRARRQNLRGIAHALELLGPVANLERGYAIVRDVEGRVVHAAGQVAAGTALHVLLRRGGLFVTVDRVAPANPFEPESP